MQINKQEKSPIKQRILQYLDYKEISKYKFYKESGITRGVLDQKTGISEDTLLKFLNYARDISHNWLLFGEGEMAKKDNTVTKFIIKEEESVPIQKNKKSKEMFLYDEADYFTTVRGDYMNPNFSNGDIVACKQLPINTFFLPHRTYVVTTEQGEIVTKIKSDVSDERIILYSNNEKFEAVKIPPEKILSLSIIIGVIKVE